MARFANLYTRFLFALLILLSILTLVIHIGVLIGANEHYTVSINILFIGNLFVLFPIFSLAKDRNIWGNEFKSCPRWMQIAVVIFAVYGLVVSFIGVVIVRGGGLPFREGTLPISAFFVGFDAISMCIPYSLLWASPIEQSELIRRARISVIAATLAVIVFSVYRAGYLHRPHAETQTIDSQP